MAASNIDNRNYNTISPSARTLLLMKGLTDIPFARQAAELMMKPAKYFPDFSNKHFGFWARVAHFENRYLSIGPLLSELPVKNILELSSGFSFRGLELVKEKNVHYIDTDLPEIIEKKSEFLASLKKNLDIKGTLETLPLNALDESQFTEIVNHFSNEEIAIVNEGLLMYLNTIEKEKICRIIHRILMQKGGYWITADIYIKSPVTKSSLKFDDKLEKFFEQHRIEENKFDSMEAAEKFFNKEGFVIDKEAEPDYSNVSTLKYLLQCATEEHLNDLNKMGKIHTTWRLKAVDK